MFICLFMASVSAQSLLYINGKAAGDTISDNGLLYVSANEFSKLLNADYAFAAETGYFAIELAGQLLFGDDNSANVEIGQRSLPMRKRREGGRLYLAAKDLAAAFRASYGRLGDKAYMLFPRAQLRSYKLLSYEQYDRVILEVTGYSADFASFDPKTNTLELSFDNFQRQAQKLLYGNRVVAELGSSSGYLKLKLIMAENSSYTKFYEPLADGYRLIIDVFADDNAASHSEKSICLVSQLDLSDIFKPFVEEADIELNILSSIADKDILANDICVAILASDIARGSVQIYYKEFSEPVFSVQKNAAEAIPLAKSPTRQAVLEKLAANYPLGRAMATKIGSDIFQNTGYRATVNHADLYLLKMLAGRAVVIEISNLDADNSLLLGSIAQSIISFVKQND